LNKEHVRTYKNQYDKDKAASDVLYRLKRTLRSRLRGALNSNQKTGSAIKDLGCSVEELKKYLENLFQDGMMWENYGNKKGAWNIDHIYPLSMAKNEEEMCRLCHFSNLQPMWHVENVRKGNRI
jgi:hypothetical protein